MTRKTHLLYIIIFIRVRMKLNLKEIPEEGLALDLALDEETVAKVSGEGAGMEFSAASPLVARLKISLAGAMVYVEGSLKAALTLDCSRCLKSFNYVSQPAFSLYFVKGPEKEKEREREIKPEDLEVTCLPGDVLDTTEVLLEQFSLDLAMQPLCKPDCKGLCPKCGADLNHGACGCKEAEKTDLRFAKLKDFKVK